MYKNVASQKVAVYAYNEKTGEGETGDAANISCEISKDGAASAATNDVAPTELDATDHPGIYLFDMTQTETNADLVVMTPVSSTTDVRIEPLILYTVVQPPGNFSILDIAGTGAISEVDLVNQCDLNSDMVAAAPTAAANADAVWDEVASGHLIAGTFGDYMNTVITEMFYTSTDMAILIDGIWDELKSGHNVAGSFGEWVNDLITDMTTAFFEKDMTTSPAANSFQKWVEETRGRYEPVREDTCQGLGNTSTTVKLDSGASATANAYRDMTIQFTGGTGSGQQRLITSYDGGTKLATVTPALLTTADATTEFIVRDGTQLRWPTAEEIKTAVWDALTADHTTGGTFGASLQNVSLSAAQVNAEVKDVLETDTQTELASVPPAAATLAEMIGWVYLLARNKITQTSTTAGVRDDGDLGNVATATVSDDGTTTTRDQWS